MNEKLIPLNQNFTLNDCAKTCGLETKKSKNIAYNTLSHHVPTNTEHPILDEARLIKAPLDEIFKLPPLFSGPISRIPF